LQGLGFRVSGFKLGFRVYDLKFRVEGLKGFRVLGLALRVFGVRLRVKGLVPRI
jgi:hypothetical protein